MLKCGLLFALNFRFNRFPDCELPMPSCWTRATTRACRRQPRRPALWSMSLTVSGRHSTFNPSCIFLQFLQFSSSSIFSDESPAAMQKSGGNGSCLRSSLNFNLALALAVSAVVRWLRWLLGTNSSPLSSSLVHINYESRRHTQQQQQQRRHEQPQHQLQQSMTS